VIEFAREGFLTLRRHLVVRSGMHVRITERLAEGAGDDPRSSAPPEAELSPKASAATPAEVASAPRRALERALLRLENEPADAAVYLDGEFLAHGAELNRLHGALPLARGLHTLQVVRPGYASRTVEITRSRSSRTDPSG